MQPSGFAQDGDEESGLSGRLFLTAAADSTLWK